MKFDFEFIYPLIRCSNLNLSTRSTDVVSSYCKENMLFIIYTESFFSILRVCLNHSTLWFLVFMMIAIMNSSVAHEKVLKLLYGLCAKFWDTMVKYRSREPLGILGQIKQILRHRLLRLRPGSRSFSGKH